MVVSIRRSARSASFTSIDNRVFSSGLSYRAMGLLTFLLSKPDHWEVSVTHLMNTTKQSAAPAGRDQIYSILGELVDKGFVTRERSRENTGKLGKVDYIVFDYPQKTVGTKNKPPHTAKPDMVEPLPDLPDTAEPDTAEPTQVITDYKVNTDNKTSSSTREEFEMHFEWEPSKYFSDRLAMSGAPPDSLKPDILGEFRSYWSTRDEKNTQARWEHKLLQAIQRERRKSNGQCAETNQRNSSSDEIRRELRNIDDASWADNL